MQGLNFVAVDFETANADRGSPCSAGMVRFRDGEPVESWYRLMRPPEAVDRFDAINMSIHRIKPSAVEGEPRFGQLWPEMMSFIEDDVLVAHNAAFDMSVLRRALAHEGIPAPDLTSLCTMRASRRVVDLLSYSLPWVADALDIPFERHHDASADAHVCGLVLVGLATKVGVTDLEGFEAVLQMPRLHQVRNGGGTSGGLMRPEVNGDADPDHPLYGQHVTFTGGLDSMSRQQAWILVSKVGGIPDKDVTKRTNILVIGPDYYQGEVLTGDLLTGRMAKAAHRRGKGQELEIMSEQDFLRAL